MVGDTYSRRKLYYQHVDRFFNEVEIGEVYEYYPGHFMFSDVHKLATERGVTIEYLPSDDPRRIGTYSFTVTARPERIERVKEPVMFDIKELAI